MSTDLNYLKQVLEAIERVQSENGPAAGSVASIDTKKEPQATDVSQSAPLLAYTKAYIDFTYKSPTVFHVIDFFRSQLDTAGFKYVAEIDDWSSLKAGKYYTVRNGSALGAFIVGKDWTPSRGVGVIGSHVDALTAKLKPASIKHNVDGYELLGVAPYGGTLGWLWHDRDLGLGGKVLVKQDGKVTARLVDSSPHPIAHIPSLAPHFGAPASEINLETTAIPVVGYESGDDKPATDEEKASPLYGKHSLKLLRYVAKQLDVKVSEILQWELEIFDVQKGAIGGLNDEFLYAPRIDDRICSYAAIQSLLEADHDSLINSDNFALVGLFDNEEIGSLTRQGIKGGLVESIITRVISATASSKASVQEALRVAYANTFILSADVIHLSHPNYQHVYLENHKPLPNTGLAISLDSNGHMATDSVGVALLEEIARKNGDKLQYFQIRNDSRSGGTIGPSVSSQTGARTIDLGIPQLSMHSIRATTGSKEIGLAVKFFKAFWSNWRKTYDNYGDI